MLSPLMGRVVAQRPGGEGMVIRNAALDLRKRPHPASPFGLSLPPHEGEGEASRYSPLAACLGLNFGAGARRMTSP